MYFLLRWCGVLLRASTFVRGVVGVAEPRSKMGAKAVQVVNAGRMHWSSKPVFFRSAPYTIENPHEGQIEVRLEFAKNAKAAAGCRGFVDGLPCVAAAIRNAMKDKYKAPGRLPKSQYPSRIKRTFHNVSELEKMLEEIKKRREEMAAAGLARF